MRVLVIEDNKDVAGNIGDFLEARGHELDFAYDGVVGLHLAVTQSFEVIILDLGLPGMDGLTLCRRLRQDANSNVPVLMLTARDMLSDKLKGFDVGADDYLVKPFALQELGARIEVLARRGRRSDPETIRVADLELHPGRYEVFRKGRRLKLNPTGFRLLRLLMEASPRVVLKADLERELWGDRPPDSDSLRSHNYALRQAVDRGFEESLLHTVHGIGYRLDPDGRSSGGTPSEVCKRAWWSRSPLSAWSWRCWREACSTRSTTTRRTRCSSATPRPNWSSS